MGRKFYLNDKELALIAEAIAKWENWTTDDRTDDEWDALETLKRKGINVL